MRSLPQHNPVHRFTLDRHLVQAADEATAYTREVARPDLLLIGAFLHDIGKGLPGDHSVVGAPIAAEVAARIGLPPADVALIEKLVRLHLLLPEVATRRDLGDPVTISHGRRGGRRHRPRSTCCTRLARADAHATGPAAWSDWKGRLIAELVRRVHTALDTGVLPAPPAPDPALLAGAAAGRAPGRRPGGGRRGRPPRACSPRSPAAWPCTASTWSAADASTVDGRALVEFLVQPRYGSPPDPVALAADLRRAVAGDVVGDPAAARPGRSQRPRAAPPPRVVWHREAATDAVVLELRAADSPGLLYRVATALDEAGAEVRAARISTLGARRGGRVLPGRRLGRRRRAGAHRGRGARRRLTRRTSADVAAMPLARGRRRRPGRAVSPVWNRWCARTSRNGTATSWPYRTST